MQVFVVSAAEVVVCWAVVAAAIEQGLQGRPPWQAIVSASVVASILFGVYHFAHSPPFNSVTMVALLSVVGLVTSAFYFASRDLAGTVVFHNFLGTFGVVQALVKADAIASFERLQMPLVVTAVVTAGFLAAGYYLLRCGTGGRAAA